MGSIDVLGRVEKGDYEIIKAKTLNNIELFSMKLGDYEMSVLNDKIDLVSVLSLNPAELDLFRKDPIVILTKYGLTGKISDQDIQEILASKTLQKHSEDLKNFAYSLAQCSSQGDYMKKASFVAKSRTVIECPNAGT
jgi:serine/threonine protein phosphatase PrpC